ncbi:MAG: hypothetical protein ACREYB_11265 [Casimicrobiaceae bacterium]
MAMRKRPPTMQGDIALDRPGAGAERSPRINVESPTDIDAGDRAAAVHSPRPHPPVEEPEEQPDEHAPETEPDERDPDATGDPPSRPPRPGKSPR